MAHKRGWGLEMLIFVPIPSHLTLSYFTCEFGGNTWESVTGLETFKMPKNNGLKFPEPLPFAGGWGMGTRLAVCTCRWLITPLPWVYYVFYNTEIKFINFSRSHLKAKAFFCCEEICCHNWCNVWRVKLCSFIIGDICHCQIVYKIYNIIIYILITLFCWVYLKW